MPKVQLASGLTVHYEQLGQGPDVVLIHGIGGNMATWHFKIVPLLWDKYRCLTYDLRGHGYTDLTQSGYTATQQADDLLQLMDALEIETVDIVGHSFGGDVALYFAYLYPERVRRIVLIEALIPALVTSPARTLRQHQDWTAGMLEKVGISIPRGQDYEKGFVIREALKYPNQWGPLKDLPAAWKTEHAIQLFETTTIVEDMIHIGELTKQRISEIETPVHLVYDRNSTIWRKSYTNLKRLLPNVTYTLLKTPSDDKSHFVPLENPNAVAGEIVATLSRNPGVKA